MKKILSTILCFISISVVAQQSEKPYVFPIRPGSAEWAQIKTSKDMDKVSVIPDDMLKTLSTKALLITCLNYPRIIDIFMADDVQSGFDFYSKKFNGLSELLKRDDLNNVLLKSYMEFDMQSKTMKDYEGKLNPMQVGLLELLIAQEITVSNLNKEEKQILLSEGIKKLEKRKEIGESLYRQTITALVLSRILKSENINLTQTDNYNKQIIDVFNSKGIILDTTIIDLILTTSKRVK